MFKLKREIMLLFYDQFKQCALNFPNNKAIICPYSNETNQLLEGTYSEINNIVDAISNQLNNLSASKNSCIGVALENNILLPAVLLGIHKYGSAFFCIDPQTANSCTLESIKKLGIKWIITYKLAFNSVILSNVEFISCLSLFLNKIEFKLNYYKTQNVTELLDYNNISYIVETSGTTGKNKQVKVTYNCIMSNINSLQNIFKINHSDIIYFGTPVTFDPFIIEIMLALTTGAKLLILLPKIKHNKATLFNILFPNNKSLYSGVTFMQMPPSVFLSFSKEHQNSILSGKTSLKILCLGGEKFPEKILQFQKPSNNLRLFNIYGITEVSCWASIEEIKPEQTQVSIGKPLFETLFQIRNDNNEIINNGEGELFIGSKTRICYINDDSPPSGGDIFRKTGDIVKYDQLLNKYFYIGRINDIIKRFGHKVNLTEIENSILKATELTSICVWDQTNSKLHLFIILEETDKIYREKIIDRLRIKLLHTLSPASNPDSINIISSIPLNKNGKVDKNTLLEVLNLNINTKDLNPKEIFRKLYSKYFGLSKLQIELQNDLSFLSLGGNSILVIQIISEFNSFVNNNYSARLMELMLNKDKTYQDYITFIENTEITEFNDDETPPKQLKLTNYEDNLINMNKISLKVSWKYDLKACVDCTPTVFEHPSLGILIAIGSHSQFFAILSVDGKLISQILLPNTIESSACISSCKEFAFIGCNDSSIYCIKIENGSIFWKFTTFGEIKASPVLCNDNKHIIFGSYDTFMYCVSVKEGNLIWKLDIKGGSIKSNAVIDNDKCYIASREGLCCCFSIKTCNFNWKYKMSYAVFASPCFIKNNNLILWGNVGGELICFDSNTGEIVWSFTVNKSPIFTTIVAKNNKILFGTYDYELFCLECSRNDYKILYKLNLNAPIANNVCIFTLNSIDYFVVPNNKGKLFIFDLANGVLQQKFELPGEVFSSPVVKDNNIYIGCRDNNLYCIKMSLNIN